MPYAADVLGLLELGAGVARKSAHKEPRILRISAVTTAGEYLVPQLIQAFGERHRELEVSLDVGNREVVSRGCSTTAWTWPSPVGSPTTPG
jgi:DNA-binding transcriptional LysR family regulator